MTIVDERIEEIRKALQMSNGKYVYPNIPLPHLHSFFLREMMAEVFIRCGNFLMLPNQLSRLDYDPGNRENLSNLHQILSD